MMPGPVASSSSERDRLAELLSGMTDEQCRKLLKMAEKIAG